MKSEEEINQQSNEALSSLDGLVSLEANHFLHAKVMHRLEQREKADKQFSKVLVYAAVILLLMLGVNVTAYNLSNNDIKNKEAGIVQFANAYNLQQDGHIINL